jgi:sporulation inhibitor KapD
MLDEKVITLNREYIVVDFEFTTYTKPVGRPRAFFSEIIEVGAVVVVPPEGIFAATFQGFVQPRFFPRIAENAAEFSMISKADLDAGMQFDAMVTKLSQTYRPGQTYLVGWGDADWTVLDTACFRYNVRNPFHFNDYLNLAEEYRQYFGKDKTPSLKNALEEQAITMEGFWHMALNDATHTAKLMVKMVSLGWRCSQEKDKG